MQVDLITPDKKAFTGEAFSVLLPGISGYFEILEGHAPLVGALGEGNIKIKTKEEEFNFMISAGVVEVLNNKVSLLADSLT
jgi:F-type H+-transporting ATPase subunit epsilon